MGVCKDSQKTGSTQQFLGLGRATVKEKKWGNTALHAEGGVELDKWDGPNGVYIPKRFRWGLTKKPRRPLPTEGGGSRAGVND